MKKQFIHPDTLKTLKQFGYKKGVVSKQLLKKAEKLVDINRQIDNNDVVRSDLEKALACANDRDWKLTVKFEDIEYDFCEVLDREYPTAPSNSIKGKDLTSVVTKSLKKKK